MWTPFRKPANVSPLELGQVLLLVDWDNLFYGLLHRFGAEKMFLEERIEKMMGWVKAEVGEILGSYTDAKGLHHNGEGFVFAPPHLMQSYQTLCAKNNLAYRTCPKTSKGQGKGEDDTVDEKLMTFGRTMLRHCDQSFLCLVSGDEDYLPLLKEAKERKVKIALVAPTIGSLSRQGGLLRFVDKHPVTSRKMFLNRADM